MDSNSPSAYTRMPFGQERAAFAEERRVSIVPTSRSARQAVRSIGEETVCSSSGV